MLVTNFFKTIEKFLNLLPKNDYPVLDTHFCLLLVLTPVEALVQAESWMGV
jgi:hypothetical protein